jgi:hypothetical protein
MLFINIAKFEYLLQTICDVAASDPERTGGFACLEPGEARLIFPTTAGRDHSLIPKTIERKRKRGSLTQKRKERKERKEEKQEGLKEEKAFREMPFFFAVRSVFRIRCRSRRSSST